MMTTEAKEVLTNCASHLQATTTMLYYRALEMIDRTVDFATSFKESLREHGEASLKEIQLQISAAVQDMGPVDSSPTSAKFLLETYSWAAVSLFGFTFGHTISCYFLTYFLRAVFSTFSTLIAAYFILPIWYILKLRNKEETTDQQLELLLLVMALIMGILSGHNLSHLHKNFTQPPAFLLPLVIGFSAVFLGPKFAKDRRLYLGSVVGSATGVYLVLGLITGNMGLGYLTWMVTAAAVAAVNLQIQLANLQQNGRGGNVLLSQFCVVVSMILVEVFIRFIFGSRNKKVKTSHKSALVTRSP